MRTHPTLKALVALSLALSWPLGPPGASAEPQTALGKTPSSLLPLVYSPQLNAQSSYHFEMKTSTDFNQGLAQSLLAKTHSSSTKQAPEARETVEMRFSGILNHRVVEVDKSGVTLSAQLTETHLTMSDVDQEERLLVESPFFIKLSPTGALKKVIFLPELPQRYTSIIQRLIEISQLSLNGDFSNTWDHHELIGKVSFLTNYQRHSNDLDHGLVTLTKRYTAPKVMGSETPLNAHIESSVTNAKAYINGAGLHSLNHTSALSIKSKNKALSKSTISLEIHRLGTSALNFVTTEEALMSLPLRTQIKRLSNYDIPANYFKEIEGLSVSSAAELFEKRVAQASAQSIKLMKAYLVRYPERSEELLQAIINLKISSEDAAHGVHAFAQIGHSQAQDALISLLAIPKGRSQRLLTTGLFNLQNASLEFVQNLWALRNQQIVGKKTITKHLMTTAFGYLGSVRHGQPEVTEFVLNTLSAELKSTEIDQERRMVLNALSNIQDASLVLPIIEPYFNSQDPVERRLAFAVFVYYKGDELFNTFAALYAQEQDEKVLISAANTARKMSFSQARNDWAEATLQTSSIPKVRVQAARILGRGLKLAPENETILRSVLKVEPNRQVRHKIFQYIVPQRAN